MRRRARLQSGSASQVGVSDADRQSVNLYGEKDFFVVDVDRDDDDDGPGECDVEMTLGEAIRFQWSIMALQRHKAWLS